MGNEEADNLPTMPPKNVKTKKARKEKDHGPNVDKDLNERERKAKLEKLNKEKMDLSMTSIVASLKNLENLFSSLDKKVQANHSDLDRKLDRLAFEQRERYEHLEKAQGEQNLNLEKCKEEVTKHEGRLDKVHSDLEDANIPDLKCTVSALQRKVDDLENKLSTLDANRV